MPVYDHRNQQSPVALGDHSNPGIAPGKRTLTQSLPRAGSLRNEQRAVIDFDDAAGDEFYDERATIEAELTGTRLTDRQIARARRRNPRWIERLKVSAQILSTASPDSAAFAFDVADRQAVLDLDVDGIAGPRTVQAVAALVTARRTRSEGAPRPTESPFAADDPFGMHLIGAA